MNRLYNFLLMLLALLLPATATAHDFEVDGIYYNIVNGNEVSVIYKGTHSFEYDEYSGSVTIPATVTNSGTTYSVTSIGNEAFCGCSSLTSVTIPNSVTSIGNDAFSSSSLTSIDIPNSVTSIGDGAFSCCSGLRSVTIPNSVTSIGDDAFAYCSSLTSIDIPNSVTSIGDEAFAYCSSLTSIDIPNSVTSIGMGAFYECYSLTSISIPNSVTTIGSSAFNFCNGLTSIYIPNSVTSIGNCAFSNCSSLTSIVVAGDNSTYDSRNNCNAIIETTTNTLVVGCKNSTIPNSVTSIGIWAFWGCHSMTNIEIPNSVTTIGKDAFSCCSGLRSVTIPNSVTSIGGYAFEDCSSLNNVYSYITDPTEITMGSSVFYRSPYNNEERTLYVPAGSLETYQADTKWSWYFGNIIEMESEDILATSIALNQASAEMTDGETLQLTATVLPEDATDKTVTWASSDENVATVDENGLVTAITSGTATITATTNDGSNLSASCVVTVLQGNVLAESIQLNVTTAGLNEGATLQLTATVMPEDCADKTVLWSSNNPSVATVDSNGLVTTHSVGTATITAMTTDGSNLSTTCTVTLLPVGVKGDVNGDNSISISDVTKLIDYLLSGSWN